MRPNVDIHSVIQDTKFAASVAFHNSLSPALRWFIRLMVRLDRFFIGEAVHFKDKVEPWNSSMIHSFSYWSIQSRGH
jgi:hypothetical protein